MKLHGFWSYTHADDDTDSGRVVDFAHDVVNHYAAARGEDLELWLDSDRIRWGDRWRDQIDQALSNVAFFTPVLTPRYFQSPACRSEFEFFMDRTQALGLSKLVMPILYIDVPGLHIEDPEDALIRAAKDFHWTDWRELRFSEKTSSSYRKAVHSLAAELSARVDEIERLDIIPSVERIEEATEDGLLDRLAALEETMPDWALTINSLKDEIERIGQIATASSESMRAADKRGKGFAARLTVARLFAKEIEEPVERVASLGVKFADQLRIVDEGVNELVGLGRDFVNGEDIEAYNDFLEVVRNLSRASKNGLGSLEGLVREIEPVEAMSKDMRAPLRRLRAALTALSDARTITDQWIDIADLTNTPVPDAD